MLKHLPNKTKAQTYELCSFFIAEAFVWVWQPSEGACSMLMLSSSDSVLFAASAVAIALLNVAHVGRSHERRIWFSSVGCKKENMRCWKRDILGPRLHIDATCYLPI